MGDHELRRIDTAARQQFIDGARLVRALHLELNGYKRQPGTSLDEDSKATPHDPIDMQIHSLLAVAIDHVSSLKYEVIEADMIPAFAGFSLLRAAIEAAGVGLWLLGPDSRDERIVRASQLAYESAQDAHIIHCEVLNLAYQRLTDIDERIAPLRSTIDARAAIRGRSLQPPTITKRLAGAQQYLDTPSSIDLISLWRICSAITHGRRDVIYELIPSSFVARVEGGTRMRMGTSFGTLATFYTATVNAMIDLSNLVVDRSQA